LHDKEHILEANNSTSELNSFIWRFRWEKKRDKVYIKVKRC